MYILSRLKRISKELSVISSVLLCLAFAMQAQAIRFHKKKNDVYSANIESLSKHVAAPEWFVDTKLGIYFHWGPYCVPAYGNEWYPRYMYVENSKVRKFHVKHYGELGKFDYHDLIPLFKAEKFDPEEWAVLFKSTGAKFAGLVAEHHDGFAMWDSEVNPWNSADLGPKRDIMGDLFRALKKNDMKTISTFHHARNGQRNAKIPKNWKVGYNSHYPYHPELITSTVDPKLRKLYGNFDTIEAFNQYWLDQVEEVVDKYDPDIIWFDSWLDRIPEAYRLEMASYFFNSARKNKKEVVTCHKQYDMPSTFSVLDYEQGGRRETYPLPWMTDITISKQSWSYVNGQTYKDASMVIRNMIDVWSKNGIVLLNISPRADGVIVEEQRSVLNQIGTWLKVNGEAVYETRPYLIFGYGNAKAPEGNHGGQSAETEYSAEDVRFTWSKDKKTLYAFFLGKCEPGKKVKMHQLGLHRYAPPTSVKRVTLLGSNEEAKWVENTSTCYLTFPEVEMSDIASVFKFELE
ncbi:alpha-L-fucosidase [Prolixibacteraceae bacterium]|nr:alpha-L-fucosidase [Prolixibacteraceae bacterium]